MAIAKGSLSQIVYQQETTYKTTPASPDVKLLYFESENLNAQRNLIQTPVIRSNRNSASPILGNYIVTGSINTHLQAYNLGTLIKGCLGSVTTTGTNPYTHVIKVGNTLPTFFIEKGFTDISQYLRYQGCYISGMSIDFAAEGLQKCSFDISGAKYAISATPLDSTPSISGGYKPFYGGIFTVVNEGGSAIATIESASVKITNEIDAKYTLGSLGEVQEVAVGGVTVSGNINAFFSDATLLNKALNSTESSLKFVLQYGTGDGSIGNEYLEIFIPELVYEVTTPAISGKGGIMIQLNFNAYYDNSTEASSIQVTLKNTESTL